MPLARYGTGSGPFYDPVEEFAAVREEEVRDVMMQFAYELEDRDERFPREMARSIKKQAQNLPTHRGRVPITALEKMSESNDKATRFAAKQVIDELDVYRRMD